MAVSLAAPLSGVGSHLLTCFWECSMLPSRHRVKMVQIYFYPSAYTTPVLVLQEEKQTAWHACSSRSIAESLPASLRQLLG